MKIKMIFWDDEPLHLNKNKIKTVHNIRGERYYEKIAPYLIEYVQINKSQTERLTKEVGSRCDETVLFAIGSLSAEDLKVIDKLQVSSTKGLHIFTEPTGEALHFLKEETNKGYSYVPGMKAQDILKMLPVLMPRSQRMGHRQWANKLNGSTLVMGYEQLDNGLGKLVSKVFENWEYMFRCPSVKLNLYSQKELGIREISELEDIFYQYTAEGAKLELNWHKSQRADAQIYFLLEGEHKVQL